MLVLNNPLSTFQESTKVSICCQDFFWGSNMLCNWLQIKFTKPALSVISFTHTDAQTRRIQLKNGPDFNGVNFHIFIFIKQK